MAIAIVGFSVFLSALLLLFNAYACTSSTGWLATYCGNAKGRGFRFEALPAALGFVTSAAVLPVSGRRSYAVWVVPASAAVLIGLAVALFYSFAEPPPGFGPSFGD